MECKLTHDPIFRCAGLLLVLLLCCDLAFFAVHSANELFRPVPNPLLNISKDKSYPEVFQYLKFFWIIILQVFIAIKHSWFSMISWILFFSYLLVDDSMRLHEDYGRGLAERFGFQPRFGLRAKDFGELCISAGSGIVLSGVLTWGWLSGNQHFRTLSRDLFMLMGLLILFGVGFDAIHTMLDYGWWSSFIFGALEDGGEMLTVSLILWHMFRVAASGAMGNTCLWDEIRIWRASGKA